MQKVNIIFPHQLFEHSPLFSETGNFCLVEEFLFFRQYNFHKQKIAFQRASMKYYENYLCSKGCKVQYIQAHEAIADIRLLLANLQQTGISAITIIDPVDDWLLKRISKSCQKLNIQLRILESPMFLNTRETLSTFFKPHKKKFFQTEFYKQERINRKILIDAVGKPVGGQWSFDEENRKKYPKGKAVIKFNLPATNNYYLEAIAYTNQYFSNNVGIIGDAIQYPIGFEESKQWLHTFVQTRLAAFGDYEDAILQKEILIHHSLLSPLLNIGMLTPQQVTTIILQTANTNCIPINSLEGFIRQIIGWREFIRGVYITKGTAERASNFWGFTRKIPASFYKGTTGILPIDETISKVLATGYCHHIERLMVLGNFMLLCEFDPNEVYRWFMELFIDAYDWVMVPNVYGMSQFADGGLMATKPYISGSNYLMKMSDYPKGDWQAIWDALFWRFLDKHRHFFLQNPRMGMLVKTFDKCDDKKRKSIHQQANNFLLTLITK